MHIIGVPCPGNNPDFDPLGWDDLTDEVAQEEEENSDSQAEN